MKTFFVLLLACITFSAFAQIPQAIKYQAVARNSNGELIKEQQISVRVSIIDSASGGQTVYSETHKTGTNPFGLFSIEIGRGIVPSGSFPGINWTTGNKWLQVEMDPVGGTNYSVMGLSEMLSVPYALNAGSATSAPEDSLNELQLLALRGDTLFIENGNYVVLSSAIDSDDQLLTLQHDTLSITNGNSVILPEDSLNELQLLALSGDTLFIENGNYVLLPSAVDLDNQTLTLSNDTLSITNGNFIVLPDNTTSPDTTYLQPGDSAGDTPYWDGAQWVVNSSNIYNAGGNIGIGTVVPTAKLHVESTGGNSVLVTKSTGGTAFVVKDEGRVGIGTSVVPMHPNSASKLTILGTSNITNGDMPAIELGFSNNGTYPAMQISSWTYGNQMIMFNAVRERDNSGTHFSGGAPPYRMWVGPSYMVLQSGRANGTGSSVTWNSSGVYVYPNGLVSIGASNAGKVHLEDSVQVGNKGTYFRNIQSGQVVAGPSAAQTLQVTIPFSKDFYITGGYNMVVTPLSDTAAVFTDIFATTVQEINRSSATVLVYCVNCTNGWSQDLKLSYIAWQ